MTPLVSVIIVSYNTRELTLRCIASVRENCGGVLLEVILVDNHSSDGSADAVRQQWPDVIVIDNPVNAGFGAANNLGFRHAAGKYLLLLNSDAFLHSKALPQMCEVLAEHNEVAVVGPRLLNADGSLQRSVFLFPSPMHAWLENLFLSRLLSRVGLREDYESWPHNQSRHVPWVVGACMLVRREVIDRVGGFDEQFFMYSEESDWQKRMRTAGHSVYFKADAVVTHLGGASGASDRRQISGHFFESLDRYSRKHHGLTGVLCLRAAMVMGSGIRSIIWSATALALPQKRLHAKSKAAFHWWLARRQLAMFDVARK